MFDFNDLHSGGTKIHPIAFQYVPPTSVPQKGGVGLRHRYVGVCKAEKAEILLRSVRAVCSVVDGVSFCSGS